MRYIHDTKNQQYIAVLKFAAGAKELIREFILIQIQLITEKNFLCATLFLKLMHQKIFRISLII